MCLGRGIGRPRRALSIGTIATRVGLQIGRFVHEGGGMDKGGKLWLGRLVRGAYLLEPTMRARGGGRNT